LFEVLKSVGTVGAQRTEGSRKMKQMGLSLQHLLRYADGEDMLNRIVTGDESRVHHYQHESKGASVQWKHPSSFSNKKFKVMPSAGKVMLTMFWDSQGVSLTHFQKHGENVNSASYCEVLLKFQDAIHRKCPGQLARGVLLHCDNDRLLQPEHPGREFKNYSGNFHLPYRLNLAPSDFSLFCPLKKNILAANVSLMMKRLKWRCGSGQTTTVKRLLCCGFWHTGKAIEQVYRCWWRIRREIDVFSKFEYHMFYVLYPFVTYVLTLPGVCICIYKLYV
jgi:hypothetical protein